MKNQISHLVFVVISTIILASCSNPTSVTETKSTPPPDTPKPIPTETEGICPPYYSEPEEVFRLDLPSDLYGMVPADFNDDGLPDVLIYRGFNQTRNAAPVEILLNDGQGNFTLGATQIFGESVPSTVAPREVILADFNGDGRSDIFVADHGMDASPAPGALNSLALSAPDGKMVDASVAWQNLTDFTHSAATADIDMDGDMDLYVGNIWGEAMIQPAIYLNTDNAGGFVETKGRLPFPLEDMDFGAFTTSEFADVNNDTFPDLILGDAGDDLTGGTDSYVLLNDGRGYFTYLEKCYAAKTMGRDKHCTRY